MRPSILVSRVIKTMKVFSSIVSEEQKMLLAKDKTHVVSSNACPARTICEQLSEQLWEEPVPKC